MLLTRDSFNSFAEEIKTPKLQFDESLKLYYKKAEDLKLVKCLLEITCPIKVCKQIMAEKEKLFDHIKVAHNMVLCEVCFSHKKVFSSEMQVFTKASLIKHQKYGDKTFKGHPMCGFCSISFYSSDELYDHCRQNHELCHICERNGKRNQYYRNYRHLEDHFNNDHYLCPEKSCLDKKFVVFASEVEYKAHMVILMVIISLNCIIPL